MIEQRFTPLLNHFLPSLEEKPEKHNDMPYRGQSRNVTVTPVAWFELPLPCRMKNTTVPIFQTEMLSQK